jgi:AraC-like DNA-binding protein
MRQRQPLQPLAVFSDLSERIYYNQPELPLYTRNDALSRFDFNMACHWHRDLEFVHAVTGSMKYFVNGTVVDIPTGDRLFVNSNRLHYGFSPTREECHYPAVVANPSLFESLWQPASADVEFLCGPNAPDYLFLDHTDSQHRRILQLIDDTVRFNVPNADEAANPQADTVQAIGTAIQLCGATLALIRDRMAKTSAASSVVDGRMEPVRDSRPSQNRSVARCAVNNRDLMSALTMTGFVHQHFPERIALADIAAAGAMSRSRCCIVFREYVNRTPNEYLTDYRIEQAMHMLSGTASDVAEVARACGFSTPSYFIRVFRKRTGLTPQQWRRAH